MKLLLAILISLAIAGCQSEVVTEFKLANGHVLIEWDGCQWEVEQSSVARARENIFDHGLPYVLWTKNQERDWFGCLAAGGTWDESSHLCVWRISHDHMKARVIKP